MKLNLTIVQQYLPEHFASRLFGAASEKLDCSRPLLCGVGMQLKAGNTYLMPVNRMTELFPVDGCIIICIGQSIPAVWQERGIPILQILDPVDFCDVFNAVSAVFDRFDRWEMQLYQALELQDTSLMEALLQAGVEIFGNRISVTDQSLRMVLSAVPFTDAYGRPAVRIDDQVRTLGPDMTASVKEVCNQERHIRLPFMSAIRQDGQRSYCQNLYPMDYFTGCIAITETQHPFTESDLLLAQFFFPIFQKAFVRYLQNYSAAENTANSILKKYLEHQEVSGPERSTFQTEPGEHFFCFRLQEQEKVSCMPKEYMHAALCTFIPQVAASAIYHGHIVGLLICSGMQVSGELQDAFLEMLERMNYKAGISNCFRDLSHLDEAMRQADFALCEGSRVLSLFTDHILDYMLCQCVSMVHADALTDPSLRRVIAYDESHRTEYLHTLEIYLKNELSVTASARDLFIHRSSLLKRLEKLEALLQDDLDDPARRLYYRIWFALRQS